MDRCVPRCPEVALLGILFSLAASSCGDAGTSGGVSKGGQGGLGSFAGSSAIAEGGSRASEPLGGSGQVQAGTNGNIGDGGGDSVPVGGAMATGGSVQGGSAAAGNVTNGGTAGNNLAGAAPTGGKSTGGVSGAAGVASLGDYCARMPRFIGTQVVDGAGDEFSTLAPMTFDLSTARYVNPSRASVLPEKVTLRAGWSGVALHVHVLVEDPSIVPDLNASLWNGDNVQLFVAPTANLTGTYTGTEDGGAIHVVISAPDAANLSRAIVIYQNGVSTNTPFVTGLFASHRVSSGYEIEAQLQWLPVANPLQSGAGMGFDVLIGAASAASQGLALEGGLANNLVAGPSPACDLGGRVQPGCDDRTWCRPILE